MHLDYLRLQKVDGGVLPTGSAKFFLGQSGTVFAEWDFDGETLVAQNDFYGFQPLFYFERENEICLSPSLVKLLELGAPLDLDATALAVFLRLGYFIGEDTPFRAIRVLPPAARLVWRKGVSSITTDGYFKTSAAKLSQPEIIETCAHLFRRAVEKMLPKEASDNFALPLSGGRDSRFILYELCRAERRPQACLTLKNFPPQSNEDAAIAAQLCRLLNVPHVILEQPASPLQPELRKNLMTHFCADEHAWYLPLADYIAGKFERIYDGLAGDVLTGAVAFDDETASKLLNSFESGNCRATAEILLAEGYLQTLLPKNEYQRFSREIAVTHLAAELEKHSDAPNPLVSFQFYNRTRREIALAPYSILSRQTKVLTPFLDRELFEFLFSLPARMTLGMKLRDTVINHSFPQYAAIPYQNKETRNVRDDAFLKKYNRELIRYALTAPRRSHLVRRSFLTTRLLRCLLDAGYRESVNWFGSQVIYLLQLERLAQETAAARSLS